VISSKIDTVSPISITPELWSIESKAEVISSKIDHLSLNVTFSGDLACAPSPITTSGLIPGKTPPITGSATLTTPGAYCLAKDINAITTGITIPGSNITLDLNGYTIAGGTTGISVTGSNVIIRNGSISGSSSTGISLTGNNNCRLEEIDVINTPTGFALQNSGTNTITSCRALQNSCAGFSLVSSGTNSFYNCQAADLKGVNNVYGFVSTGGASNIFEKCIATNIQTNATTPGSLAGGFDLPCSPAAILRPTAKL
jgi:parallel beta-helix repeat protein